MKNERKNKKSPKKFRNFLEEDEYYPDRGMKRNKRRNERRSAKENLRDFSKGNFDKEEYLDYNDEQE